MLACCCWRTLGPLSGPTTNASLNGDRHQRNTGTHRLEFYHTESTHTHMAGVGGGGNLQSPALSLVKRTETMCVPSFVPIQRPTVLNEAAEGADPPRCKRQPPPYIQRLMQHQQMRPSSTNVQIPPTPSAQRRPARANGDARGHLTTRVTATPPRLYRGGALSSHHARRPAARGDPFAPVEQDRNITG